MQVRQSTAVAVEVGPILNVDGTPYVTDDLTRADFRITKAGTSGALDASATVAHVAGDEQGMFKVTLTADDTDTLGTLFVTPNKATLAGFPWRGNVLTADAWDALHTAADGKIRANTTHISGTAQTAKDVGSIALSSGKVTVGTNDDKTGYSLAADQSAVTIGTVTTLTGHTAQTGDSFARLGAPAGASVSADVAAVKAETAAIVADTNELQANQGNWLTATGFSTHSAADVVTALGTGSTLTACATATGFSTHSAADVVTALGTGSTLTACATATGFSTHTPADVLTAFGTGSTLTACATATGFSTHTASDVASLILVTPANKLATDASGYVTAENMRGTNDAYTGTPPTVEAIAGQVRTELTAELALIEGTNEIVSSETHGNAALLTAIGEVKGSGGGLDEEETKLAVAAALEEDPTLNILDSILQPKA